MTKFKVDQKVRVVDGPSDIREEILGWEGHVVDHHTCSVGRFFTRVSFGGGGLLFHDHELEAI